MKRVLLALPPLAAVLASCGIGNSIAGSIANDPPCCKPMPAPDELFQGMQIFGSTAIADSRYIVIRDNAEYQAFWYEHHRGMSPVPPLPTFNFTGYMLVGIVLGLVDDCHFVVPRGIVRVPTVGAADHIEVSYAVQDPGDACRNHRIPGSRILLEAMRRTDLPIVFVQVPR